MSSDGRRHEVAILRMNDGQILLDGRGSLLRVETVDLKKFLRPVFKILTSAQCPSAHVSITLRFGEIELSYLEFLGTLAKLFLGTLALLARRTRASCRKGSPFAKAARHF
jgi:hypothetical protein